MRLHHSPPGARARVLPVLATGLAALALASCPAAAAPKEVGIWIDNSGDGAVKIEPCGNKLCGRIIWLKNPLNDKGLPKRDRYNPDESRRNRPICGLPILGDLVEMPEGGFDNGWVYDPKEGKSYSVAIAANGSDQLSVTGYKGVKFLGKTFTWTRATTALPSCEVQPASAKPTDGMGSAGAEGAGGPIKIKKVPVKVEEAKPDAEAAPAPPANDIRPAKDSQPKAPAADNAAAADKPVKKKPVAATAKDQPAKPAGEAAKSAATSGEGPAAAETKPAPAKKKPATSAATDPAKAKKPSSSAKAATTEVLPWAKGQ